MPEMHELPQAQSDFGHDQEHTKAQRLYLWPDGDIASFTFRYRHEKDPAKMLLPSEL